MTVEEHNLLVLVMARVNQHLLCIEDALKSTGVVTADDLKAFHFAAWSDDQQIIAATVQARADYLRLAKLAGVEVPEDL